MKSNWKEERLGSLVRFSSGGTPNKNNPSYWNGTIPWISAKNMKSEVIETSDLSITEEGLIHGSKIAPLRPKEVCYFWLEEVGCLMEFQFAI